MNDHEPPANTTDNPVNVGQTQTDATPVAALTLGDIQARRDEIAAGIRAPDLSSRASVAALVAVFRDEIATARIEGKGWAEIAMALSKSGVAARADAVRMAYRRLPAQHPHLRPRTLTRPVTADQPVPAQRSPEPLRSVNKDPGGPSIARRVR